MYPTQDMKAFADLVRECLDSGELAVIIARRPCLLSEKKLAATERAAISEKCTT